MRLSIYGSETSTSKRSSAFCVKAPNLSGISITKATRKLLKVSQVTIKERQRRRLAIQERLQLKSKADFGVRSLSDTTKTRLRS